MGVRVDQAVTPLKIDSRAPNLDARCVAPSLAPGDWFKHEVIMMSTACLLTRSVGKKLAITATLALIALAYTGPAFALEATIGPSPVTCSAGESRAVSYAEVVPGLPAHMRDRSSRQRRADTPIQVAMETSFDPATHLVRVTLQPRDSEGEFVSRFRPQDVVVYEDGVRQVSASVTVERPAATMGILIEHGGRYQMLNEAISEETSSAAREFIDEIRPGDRVAVWLYGGQLEQVAAFSQHRKALRDGLNQLDDPLPLTESNLYDAVVGVLAQMHEVSGPKALLLISSGVDTFSHASLADVLRASECSGIPVYAIDLATLLQHDVVEGFDSGPYGRLDWDRARAALAGVARASGGRMVAPESVLDLPDEYDDLMEDIRARYLITYRSPSTQPPNVARSVRVELRAGGGGGPPRMARDKRRAARAMIVIQSSYLPNSIVAGTGALVDTSRTAKR